MSKIIMDLIGENCKIKMEETFAFTNIETVCTVLEADEEWIKIAYFDKKGNTKTKLVRIESIMHIELTGK